LIIGILVLLTALNGCCLCKSKNKTCFALPFGFITFVVGIAMIVLGVLALSAGSVLTPEKFREPICASEQAK